MGAYIVSFPGSVFSNEPIKAKIANAEQARVHTMLVIGGRDLAPVP